MKPTPNVYRIQEFASIAGVTVRALHHYDRLGLLKPSARSNESPRSRLVETMWPAGAEA